jgi:phosphomannomutase
MTALDQKIFKAYDIRGIYPKELNEGSIRVITESLAAYFKTSRKTKKSKTVIIIGHDARLSALKLYQAAIQGITNKKMALRDLKKPQVIRGRSITLHAAGLITTPMLYFLVDHLKAAGGIIVTASHNPKQYNGLKVVGKKVAPMSGKEIELIVTAGVIV